MTCDCREARSRLYPFLDEELEAEEREAVEAHLAGCAPCRREVAREREFRRRLLDPLPHESAPPDLVAEVERLVDRHFAPAERRRRPAARAAWPRWQRAAIRAAAAVLVLGLLTTGGWFAVKPVQATSVAVAAVAQHDRFVRGLLEPEVRGPSQVAIDGWLSRRVDFPVRFPELPTRRGPGQMGLIGARLTYLGGTQAAFLMYDFQGEKISLFALPREASAIQTNTALMVGRTTFYYRPEGGYEVMMWTHGAVSYVLISTLTEAVGRACVVCHSPAETDGFYFRLKPLFSEREGA